MCIFKRLSAPTRPAPPNTQRIHLSHPATAMPPCYCRSDAKANTCWDVREADGHLVLGTIDQRRAWAASAVRLHLMEDDAFDDGRRGVQTSRQTWPSAAASTGGRSSCGLAANVDEQGAVYSTSRVFPLCAHERRERTHVAQEQSWLRPSSWN